MFLLPIEQAEAGRASGALFVKDIQHAVIDRLASEVVGVHDAADIATLSF